MAGRVGLLPRRDERLRAQPRLAARRHATGPRLFRDYHGNLIKGRAIYLGQKACANGTMRTDLFIHTEQGAGSRQCPDRRGDQVCRWEYPKINDYRSYGCIKLSPGDLRELYAAWARWFPVGSTDRRARRGARTVRWLSPNDVGEVPSRGPGLEPAPDDQVSRLLRVAQSAAPSTCGSAQEQTTVSQGV